MIVATRLKDCRDLQDVRSHSPVKRQQTSRQITDRRHDLLVATTYSDSSDDEMPEDDLRHHGIGPARGDQLSHAVEPTLIPITPRILSPVTGILHAFLRPISSVRRRVGGHRARGIAHTLAKVIKLTFPYFRSEDRWAGRGLLGAILAIELAQVGIAVLLNSWNARFYDALQHKNASAFGYELLVFAARWRRSFCSPSTSFI